MSATSHGGETISAIPSGPMSMRVRKMNPSATLIQADNGSRTKDSRGTRAGFLYCVAAAVFGVFTQPGSFANRWSLPRKRLTTVAP